MRYKLAAVIGLMSCVLASSISANAEDMKVAYANLSEIFDSYGKTKEFDAQLQKEAEEKRAERETMVASVKSLRDELELLSPEAKAQKEREIDTKVQELQAFDRDTRLALRQKRDDMIREVLKEIEEIVQKYGNDNGYDYIFNDRILLFKKEKADITKDIIKNLNG